MQDAGEKAGRGGPELCVTGTGAAQVSRGTKAGTLVSFLEI